MTTFSKVTTVDTTNLQPGELIHVEFSFFDVTFIHGFTSVITGVCENIIMIWLFHTASRLAPDRIILFILTTLKNKQHPCKCVRVDEDGCIMLFLGELGKCLLCGRVVLMSTWCIL